MMLQLFFFCFLLKYLNVYLQFHIESGVDTNYFKQNVVLKYDKYNLLLPLFEQCLK